MLTIDKKKTRIRKVLLIILLCLLTLGVIAGVFFGLKWYLDEFNQNNEVVNPDGTTVVDGITIGEIPESEWYVPAENPKFLSIPSIGINNARVENLGIKAGTASQMDDPIYSMSVGWYRDSARPGDGFGVGLYDGHFGVGAYKAVFTNLARVAIGAEVIIERGDGAKFTYSVVENTTAPLADININAIVASFDPNVEGIMLITCAGTWDVASQAYDQRTFVRAVII